MYGLKPQSINTFCLQWAGMIALALLAYNAKASGVSALDQLIKQLNQFDQLQESFFFSGLRNLSYCQMMMVQWCFRTVEPFGPKTIFWLRSPRNP